MRLDEIRPTIPYMKSTKDPYLREISEEKFNLLRETKCSRSKDLEFYRGVRLISEPFIQGRIRFDRKPAESNERQVEIFDTFMLINNWPFRKSNTLSISRSKMHATRYSYTGGVYQIYPFNGARYFKSNVFDLIDFPLTLWKFLVKKGINVPKSSFFYDPYSYRDFIKRHNRAFIKEANIMVTSDPSKLPIGGSEILVYGNEYIGVRQ